MQALVATYPALLGRAPEQLVANISSLAQHLQLPAVCALACLRGAGNGCLAVGIDAPSP
jgi:hypothetical protein